MNEQLESIKTYLLVAFIFAILALVPWVLALIFWSVVPLVGAIVASLAATPTPFGGMVNIYSSGVIIWAVFWLIFWGTWAVFGLLCTLRINKMRRAADRGDLPRLKALNSVGWGVAAIFFSGIVPGIMLLIAAGPIKSLRPAGSAALSLQDMSTLTQLKSLVDGGVISQVEFDAQKARLLGGIPITGPEENELQQLKALRDAGVLSAEEYEVQKQKLLASMGMWRATGA